MARWWLFIAACLSAVPAFAGIEIIDLPDTLNTRYDLTWQMTVPARATTPVVLGVEEARGAGYQLRIEKGRAVWSMLGAKPAIKPVEATISLTAGQTYTFTFKRRPDTMALLCNHRLALDGPAPTATAGTLTFKQIPDSVAIDEARYQRVGKCQFGDDYMRPEEERFRRPDTFLNDSIWKVGFYRVANPSERVTDPKTNQPLINPWSLSLFPNVSTSTNGFWYLYNGNGPSWVVANPTMVYPNWDSYYVQAAVRTEYDGEVGLIAAYQDNKNYLLFRWQEREYIPTGKPRAELIAVIDGHEWPLASDQRGFDPSQWYTLRINLGWKRVQALVDGKVLMEAENPGPVEGRVGLYANGAEHPRRPKVDADTASMYMLVDKETGKIINDAADDMRTTSRILFDDVKVEDWMAVGDIFTDSSYPLDGSGKWSVIDGEMQSKSAGRMLTGSYSWSHYVATTRIKIPPGGSAGLLFHMNTDNAGYLWLITAEGQRLQQVVNNYPKNDLDHAAAGLKSGEWADLRVEADGPYVALYLNGTRVMDWYDPNHTAGRCGIYTQTPGTRYRMLAITPLEDPRKRVLVHNHFTKDSWLVTWSSPEAEWYPSFTPRAYVTPGLPAKGGGRPHDQIGAAAPLPTDAPGLYWHKSAYYHDVRLIIPVTRDTLDGQYLHLASNYVATSGYRLRLVTVDKTKAKAQLMRQDKVVGEETFPLTDKSQLIFERRGSYLLLRAQSLDPADTLGEPEVLNEQLVFLYRDPAPLKAEMVGVTVTTPKFPAANVVVESDRIQETFEKSPVGWITQSGVWAVMARYTCQPQWNWYGGFGGNTPTVWSKYRYDGDQNVEVYMGIKMQFDNAPEEYARRYRDMNITICADGQHLNSGYTLIRGGKPTGTQAVTMLLRKGVVIWSSSKPEHLVPPQNRGHRQWPAMRLEKRGAELKVFLDNRLVTTYVDPDPLPGGYVGCWTLDNGIMIGRVNIAAEKMALGTPKAQWPLVLQENLESLPMPKLTLNDTPLAISTFESGLDGWQERKGTCGRMVRERVTASNGSVNTFLKVVNSYPAGDFSVSVPITSVNLDTLPMLHFDYNFDTGAQVNLYVRVMNTWYELLLTGREAQEANVCYATLLGGTADGNWHHLAVDIGKALQEAIFKQTGKQPVDLAPQEMIFADWSALSDLRHYGFGRQPGGMAIRFDNFVFTPRLKGPVTLGWSYPGGVMSQWKTGVDTTAMGIPAQLTPKASLTVTPQTGLHFFHLQGQTGEGKWRPVMTIPLLWNG
ncbi:MAG: family 16 glycoside hydrolase [Armatimonadota bacterium]